MKKYLFFLLALLYTQVYADVQSDIVKNIRAVCQAPEKKGEFWKVDSSGKTDIKIDLLGTKLNLSGKISAEEWDGVQQVLKKQQAFDNENYRECARELVPIFMGSISIKNKKSFTEKNNKGESLAFSLLPKIWDGFYKEKGKSHQMTMQIEKFNGKIFFGKVSFPDYGNTITTLHGTIIDEKITNGFVERTKWKFLKGYKEKTDYWIEFTLPSNIQGGSILLNSIYYARIEGASINGVEFREKSSTSPIGEFELVLENGESK